MMKMQRIKAKIKALKQIKYAMEEKKQHRI